MKLYTAAMVVPQIIRSLVACCLIAQASWPHLPGPPAGSAPIPEDEAWVLFFLVMRTMPPPHWDFETKVSYLQSSGLQLPDIARIVRAADAYFSEVRPLDEQILRIHRANAGRNNAPDVVKEVSGLEERKRAVLLRIVSDLKLQLAPSEALKLDGHIAKVRREARVWRPGEPLKVLPGNGHAH